MRPWLSGNKTDRRGKGGLCTLHVRERFANDLLGYACAFAALATNAGGFAYLTIAAATFVDRFTDLTVSDALAETHVHTKHPLGL